jgi:Asp-tRNA(Asn)/Glu-tRNA(Gln) amidotransferase A subunit family amidase
LRSSLTRCHQLRAFLAAPDTDAVATFRAMYQLQEYKAQCDALLETLDCVLTPTCPPGDAG